MATDAVCCGMVASAIAGTVAAVEVMVNYCCGCMVATGKVSTAVL